MAAIMIWRRPKARLPGEQHLEFVPISEQMGGWGCKVQSERELSAPQSAEVWRRCFYVSEVSFGWRTAMSCSQPLALKLLHCTCQPRSRGRADAFTAKETLSGMLGCPGLSHQLPKWKTSRSEDEPSIGVPSPGRLVPVIRDWSGVLKNTEVFAFFFALFVRFPSLRV